MRALKAAIFSGVHSWCIRKRHSRGKSGKKCAGGEDGAESAGIGERMKRSGRDEIEMVSEDARMAQKEIETGSEREAARV